MSPVGAGDGRILHSGPAAIRHIWDGQRYGRRRRHPPLVTHAKTRTYANAAAQHRGVGALRWTGAAYCSRNDCHKAAELGVVDCGACPVCILFTARRRSQQGAVIGSSHGPATGKATRRAVGRWRVWQLSCPRLAPQAFELLSCGRLR